MDSGEDIMSNVSIKDVIMKVVDDGTIGAIDSKSSTTLEVPDTNHAYNTNTGDDGIPELVLVVDITVGV
jgi:hypothetical protein